MDFQDYMNNPTTAGRSPRRELQGPRPTPLRINKDSHKIKKPPLAPQVQQSQQQQQQSQQQQQRPPRQPIIIYTVSPKVIHTTPGDFMSLVQRLTGSSSSSDVTVSNNNNDPFNGNNAAGMVSPAARYATIEKARSPMQQQHHHHPMIGGEITIGDVEGIDMMMERSTTNMFQGILSPGPAALSPIPPSFFSPAAAAAAGPTTDPGLASFLHDLSPALHSGNRSFMDGIGGFMIPSPSNFVSPLTPSVDLFNYFLD